ncbi:MAG: type II toxin-antitoxin system VapC family toxin, partial [Candidatus Levyibacteriota bacterium]
SVIAKWFFVEDDSDNALIIKEAFTSNKISVAIPLLLYYEINNLLKTAVKKYRIDENDAAEVYKAFLQLNFVTYSSEFLMEKTLAIAIKHDISSYDATYIALAEYLQIKLLTADQKLLNKVQNKFVIHLNNY